MFSLFLPLAFLSTSYAASLASIADHDLLQRSPSSSDDQTATSPSAIGPVADLVIVNKMIAPDGFERSSTLAGGIFPGPLIKGKKGDAFQINVIDQLTDNTMPLSTSVHWHGIVQNGTNESDGVAFVNQCPIAANESFLYQWQSPNQAGTFWYHSHLSTQYCDGLRGPLVIYDPDDPHADLYDVDDETTILTLADWYHNTSIALNPFARYGVDPNSTLINGLGRYAGGPASPLAVINVEYGKRYRFRMFAMSCTSSFNLTIDHHTFTIIEADSVETQPLVVDSIEIFAGQRYSFILNANQTVDNYWIRAQADVLADTFADGLNSAILRYSGAPETDPTTAQTQLSMPLQEIDLVPLTNPAAPGVPGSGNADVNLNIDVANNGGFYSMNNGSWNPPTVPVLLQILSGARQASELLPPESGTLIELESNKVVEISLAGIHGEAHPMHLHGHPFSVVRSAGSTTYNYVNPIRRDVSSMGIVGDNLTFRFVTDNSGPWFLHCHIDWHLQAGFAMVFAENINGTSSHLSTVPEPWENLCPIYNSLSPDQQ